MPPHAADVRHIHGPTFAASLRRLRTDRGLSQAEVARRLGFSAEAVGTWERLGTVPNRWKLGKVAELLGVSLAELVGQNAAHEKEGAMS